MVSKSGKIETIWILILGDNSPQTLHEYCFPNLCRAPFSEKQSPIFFFKRKYFFCFFNKNHLIASNQIEKSSSRSVQMFRGTFPYWLHCIWCLRHFSPLVLFIKSWVFLLLLVTAFDVMSFFIVSPSDLALVDLVSWHLHNIAHIKQHLLVTCPIENFLHLLEI